MRIITGEHKGRTIRPVKGYDIRYTADRVKESLFSILRDSVFDADFLDLYAGSGNVGIEALSRGAKSVIFVDFNALCVKTILSNLEQLKVDPARFKIIKIDAINAIRYFQRHDISFDLIFLDPPYNAGLIQRTLEEIAKAEILRGEGCIIAEHDAKEHVPQLVGDLVLTRQNRYGTTLLSFYRIKEATDGFE